MKMPNPSSQKRRQGDWPAMESPPDTPVSEARPVVMSLGAVFLCWGEHSNSSTNWTKIEFNWSHRIHIWYVYLNLVDFYMFFYKLQKIKAYMDPRGMLSIGGEKVRVVWDSTKPQGPKAPINRWRFSYIYPKKCEKMKVVEDLKSNCRSRLVN